VKGKELRAFERVEEQLVRDAVRAADQAIVYGCCGNPEALLLTALVAEAFRQKAVLGLRTEVWRKEMQCGVEPDFFVLDKR